MSEELRRMKPIEDNGSGMSFFTSYLSVRCVKFFVEILFLVVLELAGANPSKSKHHRTISKRCARAIKPNYLILLCSSVVCLQFTLSRAAL